MSHAARMGRLLFVVVLVGLVSLFSRVASAYAPPPAQGAVTDTSGKLTAADDSMLEAHIAAYRARTTNELAVLMVGSIGAESIDDVAYGTFNTWGVGKKGTDNGVLLVIAPNERKMRIETGKGVGDRLTDLESSRILRDHVGPLLKQDRFREAIIAGLTAIEAALDGAGPIAPVGAGTASPAKSPKSGSVSTLLLPFLVLGFCGLVVLAIVVAIARAIFGRRSRGRSGSSWSSSEAPFSSGGSWTGGSGGGGGSDFGGGGGSSGGGGGSDFGGGSSGGGGSSDSY